MKDPQQHVFNNVHDPLRIVLVRRNAQKELVDRTCSTLDILGRRVLGSPQVTGERDVRNSLQD